jgi:hypothetical protein
MGFAHSWNQTSEIGKKRQPILFELREKSSKTDFSSVLFLLKLLLFVQIESFIEALYGLVQQTFPSFGSNYGQNPPSARCRILL